MHIKNDPMLGGILEDITKMSSRDRRLWTLMTLGLLFRDKMNTPSDPPKPKFFRGAKVSNRKPTE